ncbi:MarR family winged helix-turn-helix transcriptional regulator [Paenibacillus sp. FA6]|uniref:MarR family winged helix-turn-helix transcriptional regulator n=1 Tax=Paenibacillus sp. FA6 TaxID=3413029 RepID=UPI003F66076B
MENQLLIRKLMMSLARMYDMEAFSHLAEFLQGELHMLHYLSQNSHSEINPSILSDKLHVSRSRITAALSTLRKKGYVTMEMSENDRRRMTVSLTSAGEAFIRGKQEEVVRYFDVLVKGLGEGNVLDMIRLIELSVGIMDSEENKL